MLQETGKVQIINVRHGWNWVNRLSLCTRWHSHGTKRTNPPFALSSKCQSDKVAMDIFFFPQDGGGETTDFDAKQS